MKELNTCSSDLRERVIVAAHETDLTQPEISATFSAGLSSVGSRRRTFRTTRRIQALPFKGGKNRVLQPHAEAIRAAVAQQPDAGPAAPRALVATKTGVVSAPGMKPRLALPTNTTH
ncbi:MAG: hypothetical protein IT331_00705 [Anaerolineae bacterium]|nr:hypothetical protein [Anaerolineae bacterium]